ncbi:hypothetical protein OE88DRAFT_1696259, partial [Heliocybe sulcata]
MLSAIAARKARLAQDQSPPVSTPPVSSPSTPPAKEKHKFARERTSKRKSSSQVPLSSPEKNKKRPKHGQKTPRYFAGDADAFAKQNDVIALDDAESSSSEEEEGISVPPLEHGVSPPRRRAWSPSKPVYDSSDEEEKDANLSDLLDIPVRSVPPQRLASVTLSTFQPVLDVNFLHLSSQDVARLGIPSLHTRDAASALVALLPDETITLLGAYTVTVLAGSVSLCGTALSASRVAHCVFAPRSSPLPAIRGISSEPADVQNQFPDSMQQIARRGGSLIWIQELRTHVEDLGSVCRTFDGVFSPSRWQNSDSDVLGVRGVHLITQSSRDTQTFILPKSWETCLSTIVVQADKPPVCLVKGPKNAGKSTFAKTLLNRLLTRYSKVAFLECDLGQSEFTPGGMVALNILSTPVFGPPFTHMSIPARAHYVGSSSPRSSPSHYLSSVQALLQTYRLDVQFPAEPVSDSDSGKITEVIPLVVNTMGWTKVGADLTRKIEEMAEPTDIFEFEAPVMEYAWPAVPNTSTRPPPADGSGVRYYTLDPIEPGVVSTNFSASDHRTISLLSYFHAVFSSPHLSIPFDELTIRPSPMVSAWNVSLPLCAQPPYKVSLGEAFDRVFLTGAGAEDVVPAEMLRVLNGAIVGLVSCEQGSLDVEMEDNPDDPNKNMELPYTQGAAPPSPLASHCHGLALIRGVSGERMHILTPVSPLGEARVLVKGELELPVWGMLDFRSEGGVAGRSGEGGVAGVERGSVPYLRWGREEGLGAERRRVRRNLMRR